MDTFQQQLRSIYEALSRQTYYHGSNDELSVGTVLTPRLDDYEKSWEGTAFYNILEMYRPKNMLSHKESVFMVDNEDDVDLAAGGPAYMFTVVPLGKVEKHDLNWSSEISGLVDNGHDFDSEEVIEAANNYWNGVPHFNESIWEYLTTSAKIVKVETY